MINEQLFCELLIIKTKEIAEKNKADYIQAVATWIARVLLKGTKTIVIHKHDPTWDHSGETVDTEKAFIISNYTTLASFIEEEYTGTSEPSFISGCGMFHNTYSTELDELTDRWVAGQLTLAIDELLPKHKGLFDEFVKENNDLDKIECANDITQLIMFTDIIGDFIVFDLPTVLKTEIEQASLSFLFSKGKDAAKIEIIQEEIEHQKRQEEIKKEIEIAKKIAEKVSKELKARHQLKYQKDIPRIVEKPYYKSHIQPLLYEMIRDGLKEEDIRKSADYLPFICSNTVTYELKTYKQPKKSRS